MGMLTFSPLACGWLSGRADPWPTDRPRAPATPFDRRIPETAQAEAVDELPELAAEAGLTMSELATAFVLTHPA